MKVRTHLALVAAGIVLPVVVVSAIALTMLVRAEREAAQRSVRETARAIALSVDREVAAAESALRALATSRALVRGDIKDFYEQALQARTNESSWILLFDRDAQQIVNTRLPFGAPLPRSSNPERVKEMMETQRSRVSDLYTGTLTQRLVVTIDVPVVSGGERYVLGQAFFAEYFQRVFSERQMPADWIAAINDREGRAIARTHRPAEFVGKGPSERMVKATSVATEGEVSHPSREGIPLYDFFTRSARTDWLVVVGVPIAVLEAPARRAALVAGSGALAAIAVLVGVALFFGRGLERAITGAADSAAALGRGRTPPRTHSSIDEIAQLHDAFAEASGNLAREREARAAAEIERARLFESEQAARRIAEAQNRAKDEFLAMLGHELRNPLAAVSNAIQLLERSDARPEDAAFARGVIARQTSHLVRLIDDLLDVGRVITGKIYLKKEAIEASAVLASAMSSIRASGMDGSHRLTVDTVPVHIEADRSRIEQVVTNLVSNAIAYTPAGGRIWVSLRRQGSEAVITVSDDGIGLKPDELERVFDLFYQAQGELNRKGGLGIGLTLVRQLVELHRGTITVASAGPGRGSTFTVHLPAIEERHERVPAAAAAPAAERPSILLIEDNEDARESLKQLLVLDGYAVEVAPDGTSGVAAVTRHTPDVALVDIGMPGMNGYEVARVLRARFGRGLTLVALTGYGQPDDERRAREAGFDAHVVKPADLDKLKAVLNRGRNTA